MRNRQQFERTNLVRRPDIQLVQATDLKYIMRREFQKNVA
jgi:hypothetical protein